MMVTRYPGHSLWGSHQVKTHWNLLGKTDREVPVKKIQVSSQKILFTVINNDAFKGHAKVSVWCQLNLNMAKLWELQKVEDKRKRQARTGLFWLFTDKWALLANGALPKLPSLDTLRRGFHCMNQSFTTIQTAFLFILTGWEKEALHYCYKVALFQARVFISISFLEYSF